MSLASFDERADLQYALRPAHTFLQPEKLRVKRRRTIRRDRNDAIAKLGAGECSRRIRNPEAVKYRSRNALVPELPPALCSTMESGAAAMRHPFLRRRRQN